MTYVILIVGILIVGGGVAMWQHLQPEVSPQPPTYTPDTETTAAEHPDPTDTRNPPRVETIAENLTIPWQPWTIYELLPG